MENYRKHFPPDPEIDVDEPPWESPCPGLRKPISAIQDNLASVRQIEFLNYGENGKLDRAGH